jgi:hypothetical protein
MLKKNSISKSSLRNTIVLTPIHCCARTILTCSLTGARFDTPNDFDPISAHVIPKSIHVLLDLVMQKCRQKKKFGGRSFQLGTYFVDLSRCTMFAFSPSLTRIDKQVIISRSNI